MEFINEEVKKCHNEYVKLLKKWDIALTRIDSKSNIFNRAKLRKEYEKAEEDFSVFSKNIYAKTIYLTYSKIKPNLIRVKTGKRYSWNEVFKDSFEKLDNLDKSMLVGLIENTGGYKFE